MAQLYPSSNFAPLPSKTVFLFIYDIGSFTTSCILLVVLHKKNNNKKKKISLIKFKTFICLHYTCNVNLDLHCSHTKSDKCYMHLQKMINIVQILLFL